jgi:hypothetical protein
MPGKMKVTAGRASFAWMQYSRLLLIDSDAVFSTGGFMGSLGAAGPVYLRGLASSTK